jgi:hypothetical protein
MKIQEKSKMIISICIFFAVILFMVFHLKEKKEPVVFKQPPIAETQNNVNSMTADEVSDLYCGIVLMPKSMLSTIEQLSKHKLAKDIKILPARIEWENGCMVAIPEETVFAYDNPEVDDTRSKDIQDKNSQPEKNVGADIKKLHPALFYLFLANASKSQINY